MVGAKRLRPNQVEVIGMVALKRYLRNYSRYGSADLKSAKPWIDRELKVILAFQSITADSGL